MNNLHMKHRTSLRQRGLTLVELMVAMVLMLLVVLATVALFNVSSATYRNVDASQELQDNARFGFEIIGQAARSAGFQDRTGPPSSSFLLADSVFGPDAADVKHWRLEGANGNVISGGNSSVAFSATGAVNSSDALVFRFFGSNLPDPANPAVAKYDSGKAVPDGAMVDCSGRAVSYPFDVDDVGVSSFFVKNGSSGEPELYCKSWNQKLTTPIFSESLLIRGVESFQVMYGLDTSTPRDDVPDQWVSAGSSWGDPSVLPNWNNVVAIRIGMVLRGPPGSGQGQSNVSSANDIYPLGRAFTCESAAATATCNPEAGLKFTPPDDGRLRRAFATTFMFRSTVR